MCCFIIGIIASHHTWWSLLAILFLIIYNVSLLAPLFLITHDVHYWRHHSSSYMMFYYWHYCFTSLYHTLYLIIDVIVSHNTGMRDVPWLSSLFLAILDVYSALSFLIIYVSLLALMFHITTIHHISLLTLLLIVIVAVMFYNCHHSFSPYRQTWCFMIGIIIFSSCMMFIILAWSFPIIHFFIISIIV